MLIRSIEAISPAFVHRLKKRAMASPLGSRLARGAFWSLFGTAISKVLSTVSWIIVGRMLGKTGFGEIGMIQNTVGLFGAAAGLGMGMAATKYVAEYRQSDPARAGRFIALANASTWIASGILSLILALMAGWLARETLLAPHLAGSLRIAGLLLFFSSITGAQTGALSGFEAFKPIAKINLIVGIASFPLMVAGAWLNGVEGALWSLIASAVMNVVLNWSALHVETRRNGIQIAYHGCWQESKIFWHFNIPGMLNTILSCLVVWAIGAILVRQAEGFGGLGIYNAAQRIKLIPENIATMLMAPMLPVLSDAFARRDMVTYGKTLVFAYVVSCVTIIPLAMTQMAAPWLTMIPFGSEFHGDNKVVIWVMIGTVAYGLMWPMGSILVSMGRIWFALAVGILYSVLNFGLSAWLIPTMQASGMALASAVAFFVASIPCLILLYREFPEMMKRVRWWTMLGVVTVLCGICISASQLFNPMAACIIGASCGLVFLIWRLHPKTNPW